LRPKQEPAWERPSGRDHGPLNTRIAPGRALPRRAFPALFMTLFFGLALQTTAAEKVPVIIDTDVAIGYPGHDVDDGLLLLIALNSPELEILGVTTSWGNHTQAKTYAKAREILKAAGRSEIPCLSGASGPQDLGRETPASRFIAETVLAHPGQVYILIVGTTTNVATAIKSEPEVAPAIKEVVSMGGTLAPPGRWPFWAMFDLNYGADVASARTVLMSGVRFNMIHSALCMETIMTPARYKRMTREAPFMRELIAEQTRQWYLESLFLSPKPNERGFVPWDVSALAYLLHPEWFHDNWRRGEIDDKGWGKRSVRIYDQGLPAGRGDFNAPDRIDEARFWEWFFQRI